MRAHMDKDAGTDAKDSVPKKLRLAESFGRGQTSFGMRAAADEKEPA